MVMELVVNLAQQKTCTKRRKSNTWPKAFSDAFIAAMIPIPDAIPTSAIRLCPQAWPISGSASYSEITQTLGLQAVPYVALKAVSSL